MPATQNGGNSGFQVTPLRGTCSDIVQGIGLAGCRVHGHQDTVCGHARTIGSFITAVTSRNTVHYTHHEYHAYTFVCIPHRRSAPGAQQEHLGGNWEGGLGHLGAGGMPATAPMQPSPEQVHKSALCNRRAVLHPACSSSTSRRGQREHNWPPLPGLTKTLLIFY